MTTQDECPRCEGSGFKSYQGGDGYEERVMCKKCGGTGGVAIASAEPQLEDFRCPHCESPLTSEGCSNGLCEATA